MWRQHLKQDRERKIKKRMKEKIDKDRLFILKCKIISIQKYE